LLAQWITAVLVGWNNPHSGQFKLNFVKVNFWAATQCSKSITLSL
jgi:hypothetical protein